MPDDPITLREYLVAEIDKLRRISDERDRLYTNQFEEAKNSVSTALIAQKESVAAAFLASEKAIVKAEDAQKEYNQRSNEFRGQLDDQAKTLMPRVETMGLFKAFDDKIAIMQRSNDDRVSALLLNFDTKLENLRVSNERIYEGIMKEIGGLRESRSMLEGKANQSSVTIATVVAVLGVLMAAIAVVVRFL